MPKDSDEHVEAQALTTAELEAFERDWADLEAHIAAIQSGAVEAPEVVEHLELLDAAPEATASDKRRAADAATKQIWANWKLCVTPSNPALSKPPR